MAIGVGGSVKVEESGYLSDESEFYGDEDTKQEFEERVNSFDAAKWWKKRAPTLMEIAEVNIKREPPKTEVKLYNPYEGRRDSWQLSETVEEFLKRLKPATTSVAYDLPWIFIANPYRKAPKETDADEYSRSGEGPPDEDSEWGTFVATGNRLLQELTQIRHETEKKHSGKAKAAITRTINGEKDRIVKEILDTAKSLKCTTGKWMLFSEVEDVNAVWAVVAKATAKDELGIAAKVAPDDGTGRRTARLICIYTRDFTDMQDVSRVLHKMKDLGLVDNRKRPIYYKCDAYTFLGLNSTNEYNIKASLYCSKDLFQAKTVKQLYSFFYKKKKDEGDWRPLEWE